MTARTTEAARAAAVAAYQRGASLRDVATAHGVTYQAVRLWVIASGSALRPVGHDPKARKSRVRRLEDLLAACRAADVDALTPAIRDAMGALDS